MFFRDRQAAVRATRALESGLKMDGNRVMDCTANTAPSKLTYHV